MSIFGKLAGLVPGGQIVAAGSFIADHWKEILLVVAVCSYSVAVFWAGGRGPRADLKAFQEKVAAERAQQQLEDAADEAASTEFVINMDQKHDERVATINRTWAAQLDSVRNESRSKPAAKPVPTVAKVCTDGAGNDRLSVAVDGFRAEVRGIVEAERSAARASRAEAARLLAVCHRQAGDLSEVVEWAAHERQLWGEAGQPH